MISTIAFGLLVASALIQVFFLLRKREGADPVSHYLILLSAILLSVSVVVRSFEISFVAVTSTFESLVFFAAVVAFLEFGYRVQKKRKVYPLLLFGGTMIAVLLLAVASSPVIPKAAQPPVPALQSFWLVLHVTFAFVGEAFFAFSFVAALMYLMTRDDEKRRNADRLIYTSIAIGYPFFTSGALIFGAIWAEAAWGQYWSWDPKETWALVTWLVYTAYLHSRMVKKFRGRIPAILAVVGFVFTIFTFFGVNYLLSGLHSYS